jgi:hypothetical protein
VPDDTAETDADDGGQAHRQRPEDHGLHHTGMADGHLGLLAGENPLAGSKTWRCWAVMVCHWLASE